MKFFLINPIVRVSSAPSHFPLGLGYIASVLREEGHEVEVLDINAYRWLPQEVDSRIKKAKADIFCLTGLITEYRQIKWLSAVIRRYNPAKRIILGGGLASTCSEIVLKKTKVDIVVIGEGELTIKELVRTFENNGDLRDIAGIRYKYNGGIYQTYPRSPIECLDYIPLPAWDLFPTNVYIQSVKLGFEYPVRTMNIISTRGCSYRCIYCDHSNFGYEFRVRSVENIIDEIKALKNIFGIEGIIFSDDLFVLNKKRVEEFSELVIKEDLGISWVCNGRVNLMEPGLLNKMRLAGCRAVYYGIESASQKILDIMQKDMSTEQAKRTIKMTRDAGLNAGAYFMIGMAGETENTVKETIDFCKEMQLGTQFSFATPIPGTLLYQQALANGKIQDLELLLEKWEKWNDKIVVNLTDMSDEELVRLKMTAEEEINSFLVKNIPAAEKIVGRLIKLYKQYGVLFILRKSLFKLLRFFGLRLDPYLREMKKTEVSSRQWLEILQNV